MQSQQKVLCTCIGPYYIFVYIYFTTKLASFLLSKHLFQNPFVLNLTTTLTLHFNARSTWIWNYWLLSLIVAISKKSKLALHAIEETSRNLAISKKGKEQILKYSLSYSINTLCNHIRNKNWTGRKNWQFYSPQIQSLSKGTIKLEKAQKRIVSSGGASIQWRSKYTEILKLSKKMRESMRKINNRRWKGNNCSLFLITLRLEEIHLPASLKYQTLQWCKCD